MDQTEYDVLVSYIVTSTIPKNYTKNQKDVLGRKAKSFLVKDGFLRPRHITSASPRDCKVAGRGVIRMP